MSTRTPHMLLSRWKQRQLLVSILLFGVLLAGGIALYYFDWISLGALLVSCCFGAGALYKLHTTYPLHLQDALNLAHHQNDQLEYSGELLLQENTAGTLAALQRSKAEELFASTNYQIPWNTAHIKNSLFLIASFLIGSVALSSLFNQKTQASDPQTGPSTEAVVPITEVALTKDTAYIEQLIIKETPAVYTGLKTRYHSDHNIKITEGSQVTWVAKTKGEIDKLYFRFSESDEVDVTKQSAISKKFFQSDFYQYGFYNEDLDIDFISDFHSIKVLLDEKPLAIISGIEKYTQLPWQEDHTVSFGIDLQDDYQLSEAYISATIAKGSGEAVKFREKKFDLKGFQKGSKSYSGSYSFSTAQLDMEPGDELYFHVKTNDNYPYGDHWSKTTTYFIAIQDTASYDYVDESGLAVDLIPDFFRSQRQIIIDSEQLLKDKANISIDSFKQASNALGFDQKLLRLKYGQFLGEESESGIAIETDIEVEGEEEHDHDHHHDHEGHDHHDHGPPSAKLTSARALLNQYMHDHDHEEEEGLLMSTKGTEKARDQDPSRPTWVQELSHNHDDAEVNTFLEISSKGKLKAALSEMWDAELHLRLYDPATSLPYQYKSLGLLQEVKNHARIYVHRIGYEPPAIKEGELRLQGDLDEIANPATDVEVDQDQAYVSVKQLIAALGSEDQKLIIDQLDSTIPTLARLVINRPDMLSVLSEANRMHRSPTTITPSAINDLRSSLLKLLPEEAQSVARSAQYAHEITLSVAKKLNF